jgi:hypothetical protein
LRDVFIELNSTEAGSAIASRGRAACAATTTASLCLIHTDSSTFDFSAIQPFDRGVGALIGRHFDEAEAAGPVGCTVHYYLRTFHFPCFRESILQVLIGHCPGQIANVQSAPH